MLQIVHLLGETFCVANVDWIYFGGGASGGLELVI
jgi:hypothetical protein